MSRVADTMDALLETATHHADLERDAREGRDWNHAFTLVIFLLFVSALLAAIVMGTRSYNDIQTTVDEVNDRRLTLDLVVGAIRANDATGSVGVGTGPEGNMLVLTEALDSGSFETRFYLYEGSLLQEYAMAGTPCTPANATVLAKTDSFGFDYDPYSGLLSVTTDQGVRYVALRSTHSSSNEALVPVPDEAGDDADTPETELTETEGDAEAVTADEATDEATQDGEEVSTDAEA